MMTTMSVSTKAPISAFALQIPTCETVPQSHALSVVAAPLTVAGVKADLNAALAELNRQHSEQLTVTRHTWDTVQHSRFSRLWQGLDRGQWNSGGAFATLSFLGGVIGAIGGLAAGGITNSTPLGVVVAAGVFATGAMISPVAALLIRKGKAEKEATEARMVEVADLAGPLQRFREATGVEKLRVTEGLDVLRVRLDAQHALSPEARAELNAAVGEGRTLESAHGATVARMNQCALLLSQPLDSAAVGSTRDLLERTPDAERPVLAQALLESIFADRSRVAKMAYDVRNELHTLLDGTAKGLISNSSDSEIKAA